MKKILISGYYGFDNFGDDAILHVMVSEIKKHLNNPQITVISNNPAKIKRIYDVDSIHRFNSKEIIQKMKDCDVFISGGGSLLQDVTSCKSFLYYLSLIFFAKYLGKKTIIFAQGIGPISTMIARFLTGLVLKKVDLITVRDKESQNYLKKLGVNSILATDPAWSLEISTEEHLLKVDKINIGIQLREWKSLTNKNINVIANILSEKFNDEKNCINLISLQDSHDLEIMQKLKNILLKKNLNSEVRIYSNLSIDQSINILGNLDYLIGMRFHACLISANFNVPTLALSYDPKVTSFALESKMPFINMNALNKSKDNFVLKLDELISNKEKIRYDLKEFSDKKSQICRDNFVLLLNTIIQE
ncbi:MAG: polysaccharide pyruvyl transferase CsaB [Candidatus Melainabacteria bacterium GWF2_32_7]|nr:MAG: polysaccharide pyruvyl transferase CsaB [Candidatus Melainabacteria bacterium GWF2_32_7]